MPDDIFTRALRRIEATARATEEMGAAFWVLVPGYGEDYAVLRGADQEFRLSRGCDESAEQFHRRAQRACDILNVTGL